jgi:branched-chain amino acid aminotransferase
MAACWLNGKLVPVDQARLSVFDHGLLYGDGVFEGIRFYNGSSFRLQEHLHRLELSARAIALGIPYDRDALEQAIRETIDAFGSPEGYIRLVVTRGDGRLGIDPRSCRRPNVFILADQLALVPREVRDGGARLIIAATRRLGPDGLDPRVKSLNYLNHILARIEANQTGADEAVLLNHAGFVTEGTAENIFIAVDGMLFTPPVTDGALDGVTRKAVIEVARDLDIPCQEKRLAPYDLFTADECFLAGTGAELIPVREIAGRPMKNSDRPVFARLRQGFAERVAEETREESAMRTETALAV